VTWQECGNRRLQGDVKLDEQFILMDRVDLLPGGTRIATSTSSVSSAPLTSPTHLDAHASVTARSSPETVW